jgi:hypothetical protein
MGSDRVKIIPKKSKAKTTNANSEESVVELEEQIRRRAYELYERRGREDSHDIEDWLQADAELARERSIAPTGATVKGKGKQIRKSKLSAQSRTSETEEERRNGN